jgi:hypothetical protein
VAWSFASREIAAAGSLGVALTPVQSPQTDG